MSRANWSKISKTALLYSQEPEGYIPALADWVECQALLHLANGCDKTTLIATLKITDWESPNKDIPTNHDLLAEDVFAELAQRGKDYGARGYPFKCDHVAGRVLKFTNRNPWPYLFLLSLSYTNPVTKPKKPKGVKTGAYIFEALSWVGMNRFIGKPYPELAGFGSCHHFGDPSLSKLPHKFHEKIDVLAAEFREGGGYKPEHTGHRKVSGDGGLDVLLRRGFPDDRGAQFFFFGGCAAGHNLFSTKRAECNPKKWFHKHFQQTFHGLYGVARGYFLPRQIGKDAWEDTAIMAGTVIDRCRISHITCKSRSQHLAEARTWTESYLGKTF